jgi:hypothetical protein
MVMLAQLVHLCPRDFIHNILDPCRAHLSRFWYPGEIEDVERDHMKLVKDYRVENKLKQNINTRSYNSVQLGFDEWKVPSSPLPIWQRHSQIPF